MSLTSTLRTNASAYAGLSALLGSAPFRWYDQKLVQGSDLPAIVVSVVSGQPTYVLTGRLNTGWTRLQFLIWGSGSDRSNALAVETQLLGFLDQCNLLGINGLAQYPNYVTLQRDALDPRTEPPTFQRLVQAMVFSNASKV